jgi:hypothetical protein
MKYRQRFESTIVAIRREGHYRVFTDMEPQKMEFTSLSDALISLVPTYSRGSSSVLLRSKVPACLSPERQSSLLLHSLPPPLLRSTSLLYWQLQQVRLSGTVWDTWSAAGLVCPFFADTVGTSASMRIYC